jgi:chaperonin GroEL (HSP60 family)
MTDTFKNKLDDFIFKEKHICDVVTVKRSALTSNCSLTTDILVTSSSPEVVRHISQSKLNIGEL